MKVQILQENLTQAVSLTSRIVSGKIELPILSNILVEAKENKLIFSATNLETSVVAEFPAKTEKPGKIAIPAKTFQEITSFLAAGKIGLEQEGEKIKIVSGQTLVQINCPSAEEFPSLPRLTSRDKTWNLSAAGLEAICSQVAFAASVDESRPVLSGVWLKPEKSRLLAVATDGYRLSKKEIKGNFKEEEPLLVPARSLLEVGRMMAKDKKEVLLATDRKQNQIIFAVESIEVAVRLISGEFPPFTKIIPQTWQTEAVVDQEELRRALKMAAVFARESANIVKLKIKKGDSSGMAKLKISANAAQVGENETGLEAKIKGEETEIAFNYRFVQDLLNALEGGTVTLKLNGALSPAIFEVDKDPSFFHIIMPVRVQTANGSTTS